MKKKSFLFLLALVLLTAGTPRRVTTIFVIGDSTAANKDLSKGKLERGWAQMLQQQFDSTVIRIDNHAVNGRSSKSFIDEGRWARVVDLIHPGDYVIIQFGHNDEKPKADRHTDPGSTFDYNLAKFVRETREHGGIPVLMSCVVRRNWASPDPSEKKGEAVGGSIDDEALRNTTAAEKPLSSEGMVLTDTHGLYRVAPRDVAGRMNVHFVDANQITHDLEQGLGVEGSKKLHMWFMPGQEPSVPNGRQDNTHYNVYGAHVVARLLADALCAEIPVLTKYRCDADITVDRLGRGDYMDLEQAVKAAQALPQAEKVIQILGGEWVKPQLPKKSGIRFVLREGASWKGENES